MAQDDVIRTKSHKGLNSSIELATCEMLDMIHTVLANTNAREQSMLKPMVMR